MLSLIYDQGGGPRGIDEEEGGRRLQSHLLKIPDALIILLRFLLGLKDEGLKWVPLRPDTNPLTDIYKLHVYTVVWKGGGSNGGD